MRKVIYSKTREVKMWSIQDFVSTVITSIIKHEFLCFSWYRIHQNNPKIKSPFYDGEYASNKRLDSIRDSEMNEAKQWLRSRKTYKHLIKKEEKEC